ncbi:dCTP deaminase [Arthrobacter polaris]|uniref:dCTP deaminase n=1 Tax=Arthrobacter polaris TaxID=2813727 RepID=UPI001F415305|nr:dCTP deaminase [Arthrobacter polaris]UIK88964.1 dCTP deaminase [Arthrobacter polaris]
MILTGNAIESAVDSGSINIGPFKRDQLNPNSYDLRLGSQLLRYTSSKLDTRMENPTELIEMPDEGYLLNAGEFYLGHSQELLGSDSYVPMLHCKSGIARLGLFIHVTADLIDIGSHGNLTFQLHPTLDVKVYPNMRIGQVSFWKPEGEVILYSGKYQGSNGPVGSLSYQSEDYQQ